MFKAYFTSPKIAWFCRLPQDREAVRQSHGFESAKLPPVDDLRDRSESPVGYPLRLLLCLGCH